MLDQFHSRRDIPATLKAVREFKSRSRHSVDAVVIEDKANGTGIISIIKKEIFWNNRDRTGGRKESRASAVAPTIEAGNVFLPMPEECPWVGEMLVKFCTFPAAKHDDRRRYHQPGAPLDAEAKITDVCAGEYPLGRHGSHPWDVYWPKQMAIYVRTTGVMMFGLFVMCPRVYDQPGLILESTVSQFPLRLKFENLQG